MPILMYFTFKNKITFQITQMSRIQTLNLKFILGRILNMESSLVSELSALRERAEGLIKRADLLKTSGNIEGIGKVKKKIQAELTFIKSVS